MCRITWAKLASLGVKCLINEQYGGYIEGILLKKAMFGWEQRYVTITNQGMESCRNIYDGPTLIVVAVNEIWTRFEIQKGYLVIKFHHEGMKEEYAIPADHAMPWLKAFCNLIR